MSQPMHVFDRNRGWIRVPRPPPPAAQAPPPPQVGLVAGQPPDQNPPVHAADNGTARYPPDYNVNEIPLSFMDRLRVWPGGTAAEHGLSQQPQDAWEQQDHGHGAEAANAGNGGGHQYGAVGSAAAPYKPPWGDNLYPQAYDAEDGQAMPGIVKPLTRWEVTRMYLMEDYWPSRVRRGEPLAPHDRELVERRAQKIKANRIKAERRRRKPMPAWWIAVQILFWTGVVFLLIFILTGYTRSFTADNDEAEEREELERNATNPTVEKRDAKMLHQLHNHLLPDDIASSVPVGHQGPFHQLDRHVMPEEQELPVTPEGPDNGYALHGALVVPETADLNGGDWENFDSAIFPSETKQIDLFPPNTAVVTTTLAPTPTDMTSHTPNRLKRPFIHPEPDNILRPTPPSRPQSLLRRHDALDARPQRHEITHTLRATQIYTHVATHVSIETPDYVDCCPTVTSYFPTYYFCPPKPTRTPINRSLLGDQDMDDKEEDDDDEEGMEKDNPFQHTVQCQLPDPSRPTETITQFSTHRVPCSERNDATCTLINGDHCVPKTTYIPSPGGHRACPTACPNIHAPVIQHQIILQSPDHDGYDCVQDHLTGQWRDPTEEEQMEMAGGGGWYEFEQAVETPMLGFFQSLNLLGASTLRRLLQTL